MMTAADIEAHGAKIKDILAEGAKSLGDVADALKLAKPSARNILKSLGKTFNRAALWIARRDRESSYKDC